MIIKIILKHAFRVNYVEISLKKKKNENIK